MLESTCRAFFDLQGVQLRPAPDAVMTTHCARVVESVPAQNRSEAVEGQIDVPAANRDANPRVGFISYSRRPAPRDAVLSGPTSRAATADERDRSGDRQHRFADRVRRPREREARTETDLASVADEGEEGVEDPQLPSQVEQAEEHWRKAADEKRMVEAEAKSRRAEEMQRRSDGGTDPTVSFPGTGDIREAWERGARAAARAHVGEAGEELASNVRQHIEEDRGYVKVRLPSLKRKAAEEARRGDVDVPENSGEAKKKEESNAGAKAHKMVEVEAHQNAEDAAHRFVDAEAVLTAEDGAPKEAESAAQQKVGAEAVKGAEAVARKEAGAAAELTSEAVELMVVEAVAQKESEAMASQKDEAAAQQNDEADAHKESAAAAQQKDEGAAPRMVEAEAQKESEAAAQQKEEGAAPKMVEAEAQKASEAAALQKEEGAAPKMVEAEAQKASEAAALQKEEGAAPKMVEAEAQKASEAAALQKEEGAASNMVEAEAQKESEAAAREKDKAAALHMEEADAHKEGEARNKAEAAARQKAEAEEQKQAAEEALQLARAEARKKAVVEAKKKAEGVVQKMSEAEEQKQAEADAQRKPDGEDGSDGNKMVQTEGRETAGAEGHIIAEEEGQHNEEAASQVFAYRETQSMAETGRQNTMEEVRVVPEAGVGHYEGDALETEEEQNEEDTVHPAVRIFLGGSPTRGPGTGVEGPWRVADDGAPRDTVDLNRQRRPTLHQRAVERNLAEKRARLASYAEQQRQLEAKAKAMAEETERLAREMEEEDLTMQGEGTWTGVEEDLTMQGEGTWTGVEEEIVEGLGTLLLIESGEANVAEGVPSVPVRNVEVSRRRPRQEDREPEGHAAKRRRAAGIQELIPIIQGEKKGMKIDKCDNRKNAVVDDKGKTLGVCLPFRGSGFSQRGEGALQKWTSEQTVGGRKRNLGSHKTVWERAYTVAVCWKFYFPDIDMQAYGMNPNRINKWREDLDFTTWLPTGVWSVINELHLDKPDGFSLVQTNMALRQQQGDGFQVAACAGVGITAWQKMVGGVEGENGYSTEEHAIGLAATLSVMWAASTNVDQTQWETGATTAARGTSTAIASSAARSSTAATASSDASSSSAADVPSAVHNALATLAASVACVAVEAMRSVKDQEHDKEAWILPLSDALLKALPAESRAAEDAKRMTRVVAKVVTSWCLCSMASRGLRQHQGVWLGVLQKKLGGRDTTTGADKEKKTKKSSAKGNATKDASTEENTGTGGQD
ncbi:unnamed protein product [Closterium sp. NIES-64]|nr:unnamed protein product [Closterium sp. NIES-64]